jgi:SAM-dependent methyltransferase
LIDFLGTVLSTNPNYDFYRSDHEQRKTVRRTKEWTDPCLRSLGITKGASILSVGCGNGIDVLTLRSLGYDAWGIDGFSPVPQAAKFVVEGNAVKLPFADLSFDAVMALEVIEHVGHDHGTDPEDRARFCNELRRVARRLIFIATPNRLFPIDEHGEPIRFHSPLRDSTLSYRELCSHFPDMRPRVMPWGKYFALERFEKYVTSAGTKLANTAFQAFSVPLLHRSPLNPHLFVAFVR